MQKILAGSFLLLVFLPFLGWLCTGDAEKSSFEKRPLRQMPSISWNAEGVKEFSAAFQEYFNDQFGFRKPLIAAHNLAKVMLLRTPTDPKLVIGRDGWFDYTHYEELTGWRPGDLAAWQLGVEARQEWLARRGARYLLATIPYKSTVYSDVLPQDPVAPGGRTRLQDFTEYFSAHSDVPFVDLGASLQRFKTKHQLFFKTDTHWNGYGAFAGYRAIMEKLHTMGWSDEPLSLEAMKVLHRTKYNGDCVGILGLGDWLTDDAWVMFPARTCWKEVAVPDYGLSARQKLHPSWFGPEVTECPKARGTALAIGDSFLMTTPLKALLAQHFGRTIFLHRDLLGDNIAHHARSLSVILDKEHPDLVLDVIFESFLHKAYAPDLAMVAELAANGFQTAGAPIFRLETASVDKRVEYKFIHPQGTPDGLAFHSAGPDPMLFLPELPYGGEVRYLKMDVTVPGKTEVAVFYQTPEQSTYVAAQRERRFVGPGRHTVYLRLGNPRMNGVLRIDPGGIPGDYVIHSLEIR